MEPTCLLFVSLVLLCFSPSLVLAQAQEYDPSRTAGYVCPPGFIVISRDNSPYAPIECDADQCYTDAVGCGPGNVCFQFPHRNAVQYYYAHECTCFPPYIKGVYEGYRSIGSDSTCYIPGQDVCSPNPCQNGGVCSRQIGTRSPPVPAGENATQVVDFTCQCPVPFLGKTCALSTPDGRYPTPVLTTVPSAPVPAPPPSGDQGVCGTGDAAPFPIRCYFNSDPQGRYVCCDAAGCDGFNPPDFLLPHCKAEGYAPPGFGVGSSSIPPATPPAPSSPPPSGSDQGVCGSSSATDFPTRCYFNSDPQGRYVCCDGQGCDGFNSDNLTPHCKNFGYVPPNFGAGTSASPPSGATPSGSQGVCGTGAAASFPVRCWYNNDPQGRYVCCDSDGCDGFLPPDNFFPHCKSNGFVPPNP